MRKNKLIKVEGMEKRAGRPKITLVEVKKKKNDMTIKGVTESMTIDRVEWRKLSY